MSLIVVPQHSREDVDAWDSLVKRDLAWAGTGRFRARCQEAMDEIVKFGVPGGCYAGTSWGKDSTVLAHLVWTVAQESGTNIPLVHVDARPINNPHCRLVRDAFLDRWPTTYDEIEVWCTRDEAHPETDWQGWHATGTMEAGFSVAADRHGARHLSGVRGDESAGRRRRMRAYGLSTDRTCAPIGRWSADDVWAYLAAHDLPVHPVYAMTCGGSLNRDRMRVAFIGLTHGRGFGRLEWERTYYPRIQEDECRPR